MIRYVKIFSIPTYNYVYMYLYVCVCVLYEERYYTSRQAHFLLCAFFPVHKRFNYNVDRERRSGSITVKGGHMIHIGGTKMIH